MAWCHQATSHYLSQCQPRSPYGSTRPQWVKWVTFEHISVINLQYVMRNCPQANTAGLHWWEVNTDSGNGLVPLGSKPLPESSVDKDPWRHEGLLDTMTSQGANELIACKSAIPVLWKLLTLSSASIYYQCVGWWEFNEVCYAIRILFWNNSVFNRSGLEFEWGRIIMSKILVDFVMGILRNC